MLLSTAAPFDLYRNPNWSTSIICYLEAPPSPKQSLSENIFECCVFLHLCYNRGVSYSKKETLSHCIYFSMEVVYIHVTIAFSRSSGNLHSTVSEIQQRHNKRSFCVRRTLLIESLSLGTDSKARGQIIYIQTTRIFSTKISSRSITNDTVRQSYKKIMSKSEIFMISAPMSFAVKNSFPLCFIVRCDPRYFPLLLQ